MRVKLYGIPTCYNCKLAIKMLQKRKVDFEYRELNQAYAKEFKGELPQLSINGQEWEGKNVLIQIRKRWKI